MQFSTTRSRKAYFNKYLKEVREKVMHLFRGKKISRSWTRECEVSADAELGLEEQQMGQWAEWRSRVGEGGNGQSGDEEGQEGWGGHHVGCCPSPWRLQLLVGVRSEDIGWFWGRHMGLYNKSDKFNNWSVTHKFLTGQVMVGRHAQGI